MKPADIAFWAAIATPALVALAMIVILPHQQALQAAMKGPAVWCWGL